MRARPIVAALLVAGVSAFAGWTAGELSRSNHVSPGEAIADAWITQITVLTDAQGAQRHPEAVMAANREALDSLSTGLALHYQELPEETLARITPYLARAEAALPAGPAGAKKLTAVDCILRAAGAGQMDPECIATAVARDS